MRYIVEITLSDPAVLRTISPGAIKVFFALSVSPGANTRRLVELTGYSDRQIRTLKRELENHHLIGVVLPLAEMNIEQKRARKLLMDFGLDSGTAQNLAMSYTTKQVEAAAQHVRESKNVGNPAGLLIYTLNTNPIEQATTTRRERYEMVYNA